MRYMHKKIYFNKFELQELEMHNPTLFELAQYVADKARITAKVMGDNWINVAERETAVTELSRCVRPKCSMFRGRIAAWETLSATGCAVGQCTTNLAQLLMSPIVRVGSEAGMTLCLT